MQHLHLLSFNMHKGVGWLSKRSTVARVRDEIRRLSPDFILLQETRDLQFEFLAEEIWPHVCYGKNAVYTKGHHGNAVLSKFPIIQSQNLNISMGWYEQRGLLHAVVQLPNKPLHVLCVHLSLLGKARLKQISIIADYIKQEIPSNESVILGGDFNDWREHATDLLVRKTGLNEAFLDYQGKYAKSYPAWAPLLQLDRLYSRGFITERASRLTKYPWRILSDHLALEVLLQNKSLG